MIKFQYIFMKNGKQEFIKVIKTLEEVQNGELNEYSEYEYTLLHTRQYVDFKDRNRDEIFEGDILKINDSKYEVIRMNGAFALQKENGDFYEYLCNMSGMQFTSIIGNIYNI